MDKETMAKYAPVALVVIAIIFQWNLFVTPEKLEIKHRAILNEVSQNYVTKEESNNMKDQLADMQRKIDKIYDVIINTKK